MRSPGFILHHLYFILSLRIIPSPKFLIVSVLLVAFLAPLAAQERLLIPYRKGTKWGFCDEKKNVVIPAKYDDVLPFADGMSKVTMNNFTLVS
jgi:WG containing repeat